MSKWARFGVSQNESFEESGNHVWFSSKTDLALEIYKNKCHLHTRAAEYGNASLLDDPALIIERGLVHMGGQKVLCMPVQGSGLIVASWYEAGLGSQAGTNVFVGGALINEGGDEVMGWSALPAKTPERVKNLLFGCYADLPANVFEFYEKAKDRMEYVCQADTTYIGSLVPTVDDITRFKFGAANRDWPFIKRPPHRLHVKYEHKVV